MTAASGADRCKCPAEGERASFCEIPGHAEDYAMHAASGADQPTLRDQLAEEAGCHGLNIGVDQRLVLCTCGWRHQDEENLTRPVAAWSLHVADALLPVVERAKAEAAAEAR